MKDFIKKAERFVPICVFIGFIIIGLLIYDDYGISWDEPQERLSSLVTYRWLNRTILNRGVFVDEGTEDLPGYYDKFYGVTVPLPLMFFEDVYQLIHHEPMAYAQIYHMRHLYCYFLFIFALFCFYEMLKDLFTSSWFALSGVLMIYCFGRFFAESFYNIKDIVFASLTMITLFCAERAFRTQYHAGWCLLFALASALLVNIRIVGGIFPLLMLLIIIIESLITHTKLPIKPLLLICCCLPFWVIITPAAWTGPVEFAVGVINRFAYNDEWTSTQLFAGKMIAPEEIPSDFYLRWIGITVPLIYLFFSLCGLFSFGKELIKGTVEDVSRKIYLLMGSILLGTLFYQMIRRPPVYNGWRHIYFLYPLIIAFAVWGFHAIFTTQNFPAGKAIASTLLAAGLLYNGGKIITNHPFEYGALNPIGERIGADYDGDYWGLSFFTALRWVARNTEERTTVNINSNRRIILSNFQMLSEAEREKVSIPTVDTDYIIVWEGIPLNHLRYDFEGYEKIKTFSAYGQEMTRIFHRTKNADTGD